MAAGRGERTLWEGDLPSLWWCPALMPTAPQLIMHIHSHIGLEAGNAGPWELETSVLAISGISSFQPVG